MLVASETTSELLISSPLWFADQINGGDGELQEWTTLGEARQSELQWNRPALQQGMHCWQEKGYFLFLYCVRNMNCMTKASKTFNSHHRGAWEQPKLVSSAVSSAAPTLLSVSGAFLNPPPLKTQRPLWCSELRQPLAMITKGFHWEHVCRILSRFFFVCVWVFALEEVIGLEFPLVSPFVVGSFWGFTLFLMQSARCNWSASVAVSK